MRTPISRHVPNQVPQRDIAVLLRDATKELREAAIDVLWRQWAALGAMAAATPARTIVDPEALVLMSLSLAVDDQGERRLGELVASWGVINAPLLSVQRMSNLAKDYPETTRRQLGSVAQRWVVEGKDHRWTSLADPHGGTAQRSTKARSIPAPLSQPAALMLRLRKAFGVGLRADVLAFLVATPGRTHGIRAVATATRYTPAPLRRTMADMADAGLIERVAGEGPEQFTMDVPRWARALTLPAGLPMWPYWHELFGVTLALLAFPTHMKAGIGRAAVGALGRELLRQHAAPLARVSYKGDTRLADGLTELEHAMQALIAYYRATA